MSFTAEDIEGGYTSVTSALYIGWPPFGAAAARSVDEGARLIRAGDTVAVGTSDVARAILVELDVPADEIDTLLRIARYGPTAVNSDVVA